MTQLVGAEVDESMPEAGFGDRAGDKQLGPAGIIESRRQKALLKTGALQDAIFNSANFSSIATDAKGVIQIFNVGAERRAGAPGGRDVRHFVCAAGHREARETRLPCLLRCADEPREPQPVPRAR